MGRSHARTDGRKHFYRLNSIIAPVNYKAAGSISRVRSIHSFLSNRRAHGLFVKLEFPPYTGLPAQTVKGDPQLNLLRGTRVELQAVSNRKLASAQLSASSGMQLSAKLSQDRNVNVYFVVENPFEFWFDLTDQEGVKTDSPPHYSVTVRRTRYRKCACSPGTDILVGKKRGCRSPMN